MIAIERMDLNIDDWHGRPPVCSASSVIAAGLPRVTEAGPLDGLLSSSFGFCRATHLAHCPRQQHSIMCEANDLDHTVRAYAIHDDVPRTAYPLFLNNQTAPNAKWVNPDASGCGYLDDRERQPRRRKRTA
jgi:hypothetical protein